jgi:2-polyprenyl-3-methyl-5-hydroxy-6-metoxy-1,4-benzoquinol methylase
MSFNTCKNCGSSDMTTINTYKRRWNLCHACGEARPTQKNRYSLTFLKERQFRKSAAGEADMYDYFIEEPHLTISRETAFQFLEQHAGPAQLSFAGKRVLDVSGGNGHFLMEIAKLGATVELTEINQPTIDYVERVHGIPAHFYDFNAQRITDAVKSEPFDYILARAAIMFCDDLARFAEDARKLLKPNGVLFIQHSVTPTLGVMLRVQLDEFSYFALRQPETVVATFEKAGYTTTYRQTETDPTLYAYDHDTVRNWYLAKLLHEPFAVRSLLRAEHSGKSGFVFRARDRRRAAMAFKA